MMSDFGCMEDWDLQAVVGGSCGSEAFADIKMENSPSLFAPPLTFGGHHHQDELLINFTPADDDFFETKAPYFDDGLEGLYKPFCPPQSMMINSSATTPPTSISAPQEAKEPEREGKKQPPFDPNESNSSPQSCTTGDTDTAQTTKSKRGRRNQHKRVVQQVAADGLSNDMWAWRKYGQKPIKGSPYPRSYYRCSSLKGCPARKQVERSSSDPSIFIITYTSEHSHAYPTRRSALAGSTRTKPSLPKQPSAAAKGPKVPTIKDTVPSPKTPSMASLEDEVWQHVSIGTDQDVEQILEKTTTGSTNNVMPDLIFPDELFPSLEDFQGLLFY